MCTEELGKLGCAVDRARFGFGSREVRVSERGWGVSDRSGGRLTRLLGLPNSARGYEHYPSVGLFDCRSKEVHEVVLRWIISNMIHIWAHIDG